MRVTIHRDLEVLCGAIAEVHSLSDRLVTCRPPPFPRNLTLKMIVIRYGAGCKRYKDIEIQAEERLYRPVYNDLSKPPVGRSDRTPFMAE